MTPDEFDAIAVKLTRMDPDSLEMAKAVLVHGRQQKDVASNYGVTKQRMSSIIRRVETARAEVPLGWIKVEAWLPPAAAAEVQEIEKRERAKI